MNDKAGFKLESWSRAVVVRSTATAAAEWRCPAIQQSIESSLWGGGKGEEEKGIGAWTRGAIYSRGGGGFA